MIAPKLNIGAPALRSAYLRMPQLTAVRLSLPRAPDLTLLTGEAASRATLDETTNELFADVDWGDDVDYGEDVVAPPTQVRTEAALFLKRLARSSATKLGVSLPLPQISPTVDGYVDLHWGYGETRELLLCVRGNGSASFFGKASNGKTIKGSADTDSDNVYLAAWLTEE